MTRDEFQAFVENGQHMVLARPYAIVPCTCGDINCRGWKLVPDVAAPRTPRFANVRPVDDYRSSR